MNRSVPLKITTANRLLSKATPRFYRSSTNITLFL